MTDDLRGRLAAAMSASANLDAIERVFDDELAAIRDTLNRRTQAMHRAVARTDRVRAELDRRRPDTLVSVRLVRHWLDGPTEERP